MPAHTAINMLDDLKSKHSLAQLRKISNGKVMTAVDKTERSLKLAQNIKKVR